MLFIHILFFILLLFTSSTGFAVVRHDSLADFITIGQYDEDKSNQYAPRAYDIFRKIQRLSKNLECKLLIVKEEYAYITEALKDGVVLSSKTLNTIYEKVDVELGDTRLALVLGHELSHLENNAIKSNCHISVESESEADEKGFLYAAIADYPVHRLLISQPDFFTYWQEKTGKSVGGSHPLPPERLKLLKDKLNKLLNGFNLFKSGVRFAHFNRCNDAKLFLSTFREIYDAPEVLNSLAYCELQQAAEKMTKPHYCVPFLLDAMNDKPLFNELRSPLRADSEAKYLLENAVSYLEAAIDKKIDYFPAYLNLAATYLYLEEINKARSRIERAIEFATEQKSAVLPELKAFYAVILYEAGVHSAANIDTWNNAMRDIETYATPNASTCILYNAAMLLEQRPRNEKAKYWQLLAQKPNLLPQEMKKLVCEQKTSSICSATQLKQSVKKWSLPFQWDTYLDKNGLKNWESDHFELGIKTNATLYQSPDKTDLLIALEGYAELFIDKHPNVTIKELNQYCATPLQKKSLVHGRLLSCKNWVALIEENQVKEIWHTK